MNSTPPAQDSTDPFRERLGQIEELLHTDPARAAQQVDEVLAQDPRHPTALLIQGIARRLSDDPAGAVESLSLLCQVRPDLPVAHLQRGLALREARRDGEAAASLRRAVELQPGFCDAWRALADLLVAMGDMQGADAAFAGFVRHAGSDPRLQRPAAALREGRAGEAESLLRTHLNQHPNDIVALNMLADIAARHGRPGDAGTLLKRCLEIAPGYHAARHHYATLLLRQDRAAEALGEIDKLLAEDPRHPACRSLKAAVLPRFGEYDAAIAIYEELLREFPDSHRVRASLGHVLRMVGRRDESIEAYRKAIELAPEFGEAYWNLANLKTVRLTDADVESMGAQLGKPQLGEEDRIHLHFALGKALEDRDDYAGAFRNYAEGNRIRRSGIRHDADEISRYVQRCRTLFTPAFFAERAGRGADAADPVFIVGLPRTGSTLVEQILASHSAVEGTRELHDLTGIALSLGNPASGAQGRRYPEVLAELGAERCRGLGEQYLEQTRPQRKLGTPYFIDKMPNNFINVGLIHLILPNARIIDVRRHPLACGISVFRHLFASGQGFSYSLEDIGRYYRDYVELMAHFDAVLPGRVHRVVYESLIEDTEGEVRRLLEHCGLPFEEACLNFHANRRAVSTPSSEQVRSPIFRGALDHWRHYEPWLDPLKSVLGPLVDAYPEVPPAVLASGAGSG